MSSRKIIGSVWSYGVGTSASTIPLPARAINRGSLVVIGFRAESGDPTLTVSDTAGGVWTVFKKYYSSGNAVSTYLAYSWNHPGGSSVTITGTLSAAQSFRYASAVELEGPDVADPFIGMVSDGVASTPPPRTWMQAPWRSDLLMVQGNYSAVTHTAPVDTTILDRQSYHAFMMRRLGNQGGAIGANNTSGATATIAAAFRERAAVTARARAASRVVLQGVAVSGGGITGASDQTIILSGAATAAVAVAGASAASVTLGGSAAAAVAVAGASAGTLALGGSGSAAVAVAGASAQTIALTGSATGVVLIGAASDATLSLLALSTGQISIAGAGSGSITLTGTATGTTTGAVSGASDQLLSFGGTAAGTVAIAGASAGTLQLSGSATGTVGATAITGQSAAVLGLTGSGTGQIVVRGTSAATVDLVATPPAPFVPDATRILVIGAELRALAIPADPRTLAIEAENRTVRITQ